MANPRKMTYSAESSGVNVLVAHISLSAESGTFRRRAMPQQTQDPATDLAISEANEAATEAFSHTLALRMTERQAEREIQHWKNLCEEMLPFIDHRVHRAHFWNLVNDYPHRRRR